LAIVLILATFVSFPATAREFPPGGTIIEVRECGIPLFVMIVTPDGKVFASPVWREADGTLRLDNKETGDAIKITVEQAAPTRGSLARFHIDRHRGRECVEAAIPGRPVS